MINNISYNNLFSPKFTSNNEQSHLNKKDNTTTNMLLLGSAILIGGLSLYSHKNISDKCAKLQDSFSKLNTNAKPEKTDLNPLVEQIGKLSEKMPDILNMIKEKSDILNTNQFAVANKLNNQNEGILKMFVILAEKLGIKIDKEHACKMINIGNVGDLVKILEESVKV